MFALTITGTDNDEFYCAKAATVAELVLDAKHAVGYGYKVSIKACAYDANRSTVWDLPWNASK